MNARPLLVTAALAALAAWVSAQPGTGPTAADSLRILKVNRGLYEDLTRHGLALGEQNTALDRADECRRITDRLGREVREAVRWNDADRLAEVSDYLNTVAADGLAPNLNDARGSITPQSEDYPRLQAVHRQAFDGLTAAAEAIPTDGDLGTSPRAKAARDKLAATAAGIGPPPAEKKVP